MCIYHMYSFNLKAHVTSMNNKDIAFLPSCLGLIFWKCKSIFYSPDKIVISGLLLNKFSPSSSFWPLAAWFNSAWLRLLSKVILAPLNFSLNCSSWSQTNSGNLLSSSGSLSMSGSFCLCWPAFNWTNSWMNKTPLHSLNSSELQSELASNYISI